MFLCANYKFDKLLVIPILMSRPVSINAN